MLTKVQVSKFQSWDKATVELGKLTVLLGPSSSGKSAFLRGLRALARNGQVASFVSQGSKVFTITAQLAKSGNWAPGVVQVERGKSSSSYSLAYQGVATEVYAKCGVNVPNDIQAVLAMPLVEGQDLNFASQFDRPFLLSEPATVAAKVLGDLTNVTLLQRAAAEANRRRIGASQKLADRLADLAASEEALEAYKSLPGLLKSLQEARALFTRLQKAYSRTEKLLTALQVAISCQSALASEEARPQSIVPDLVPIENRIQELVKLRLLIATARTAVDEKGKVADQQVELMHLADQADVAYSKLLAEAGQCPVCGQLIS